MWMIQYNEGHGPHLLGKDHARWEADGIPLAHQWRYWPREALKLKTAEEAGRVLDAILEKSGRDNEQYARRFSIIRAE